MTALQDALLKAIQYSDHFDFPLTAQECFYWTPIKTNLSAVKKELPRLVKQKKIQKRGEYYFLPGRLSTISLRQKRLQESQSKWQLAKKVGDWLKKIPTIEMIAVTGSLAMNNPTQDDDIDLMIVTVPNTLWITRLLIWLILKAKNIRRATLTTNPRNIKDKICDNLYLDSSHLSVDHDPRQSLYLAHEILQAKPLFDVKETHHRFLSANAWVSHILPNVSVSRQLDQRVDSRYSFLLLSLPNIVFFLAQYLYMKPKITSEKISLHSAFFHPKLINNLLQRTKKL